MKKDTSSITFEDITSLLMKKRYIILFLIILISTIVIIFWQGENKNTSITVELDILSIEPEDSSLNSTIKILFNNSSGQQAENLTCNCSEILYEGETQVVVVDDIMYDRFSILLAMDGKWDRAIVNLRVNGTDKDTESFTIIANHSQLYDIPKDVSKRYYFKIDKPI